MQNIIKNEIVNMLEYNGIYYEYAEDNIYHIVFNCVEDYDRVLNYIVHTNYTIINNCVCGEKLICAERNDCMLGFKV